MTQWNRRHFIKTMGLGAGLATAPFIVRAAELLPKKGRRVVIFSGGGKAGDEQIFEQARAIRDGGGFGSIIGRNSFQRPRADAVKLLHSIMEIYKG